MNNISFAGSGLLVLVINGVLQAFGITPDAGSVAAVIQGGVIIFGWVLLIVGQLKRKDLHYGLLRK
jgi:hypothetical protein